MPIVTQCPECGKKMRAPDEKIGRNARCSQCETVFPIEPLEAEAGSQIVKKRGKRKTKSGRKAAPPKAEWTLQMSDGEEYGPITKSDLDSWLADGRVDSDCQILRDGWDQWKWAAEIYPELAEHDESVEYDEEEEEVAHDDNPFAAIGGVPAKAEEGDEGSPFAAIGEESVTASRSGRSHTPAARGSGEDALDQGWYTVATGLKTIFFALIVAIVGYAVLSGGLFMGMEPGVRLYNKAVDKDQDTAEKLNDEVNKARQIVAGGAAVLYTSMIVAIVGGMICMAVPREARAKNFANGIPACWAGTVMLAVGCAALAIPELTRFNPAVQTEEASKLSLSAALTTPKWLFLLTRVVFVGSFALLAWFLVHVARFFDDQKLAKTGMYFSIFVGVFAVVFLAASFMMKLTTSWQITLGFFTGGMLITLLGSVYLVSVAQKLLRRHL